MSGWVRGWWWWWWWWWWWCWGRAHGTPKSIEERACGNSRGQISKSCHTILQNFQGCKLVFSGISNGKVKISKFLGRFQKSLSSTPLFWFFLEYPLQQMFFSLLLNNSYIFLTTFLCFCCSSGKRDSEPRLLVIWMLKP